MRIGLIADTHIPDSDQKQSFYWPELTYVNPAIDVGGADILSAGCDIGSTSSQMVILIDGELYAYASMRSKGKSAQSALEKLIGITALRPNFDTQIVGAVGAALYARALVMREKGLPT
jgi:activator of 2-hydroxyglutaryl-CoA dehydratase